MLQKAGARGPERTSVRMYRRDALAAWTGEFLGELAVDAEDGLHPLRVLERDRLAGRRAVKHRRRGWHAAAAVDILAAGLVTSATSLAAALGCPKNAARSWEGLTAFGIAVKVTRSSKRRLDGLRHLVPLR